MKLWLDFQYALRLLRKTPGFSLLCLVVVALGVSISLYTFTLIYEFTVRPPPFPDGKRFAVVKIFSNDTQQQQRPTTNVFIFNALKERASSFAELGLLKTDFAIFTDGETTQQFYAGVIDPTLIEMTKEKPYLGRLLTPQDGLSSSEPVALIGYDLWQSYFASDPDVIGKQTNVNGVRRTIVGVMPENFQIALPHELWLPLDHSTSTNVEDQREFEIIGSLRQEVTFEQASNELTAILTSLAKDYPDYLKDLYIQVQPIGLIGSNRTGSEWAMPVICILVMLITAINLSALLFVRANSRQRELAVRSAVGASSLEIKKQVLLESFILCFVGTVIAIGMAEFVLLSIEFDSPTDAMGKSWRELYIHANGLIVAAALMLGVWLISGLATSIRLARQDVISALQGSQQSGSNRSLNRTTKMVVGIEVVLSFLLLVVCGSLTSAIVATYSSDYGATSDGIVKTDISLRDSNYEDPQARQNFIDALLSQLQQEPSIYDAAVTTAVPGSFARQVPFLFEDRELGTDENIPSQGLVSVSENYFDVMKITIADGQEFTSLDNKNSQPVAIVDDDFAKTYWPNESALGKRIKLNPETDNRWLTIIGVNNHVVQGVPVAGYDRLPTIYVPLTQNVPTDFSVVVQVDPQQTLAEVTKTIRLAVAAIDKRVAASSIYELSYEQKASLTSVGAIGKMLSYITVVVLGLSMIGIYGIISRSVALRGGEIGIRRAVGSSSNKVSIIFFRQGCFYLVAGILLGALPGILLAQNLASFTYDIANYIPTTVTTVTVFLGGLILLASYLPARKILMKEPGDALRYE